MSVHSLGVKAMAAQDDEMLELLGSTFAFETTVGSLTLAELTERNQHLAYCDRVGDYRQLAPIAGAQGLVVINAGYAYDTQLIARWLALHPGTDARRMSATELLDGLQPVDGPAATRFDGLLGVADQCLGSTRFSPVLRSFEPTEATAVLLSAIDADREADRAAVSESAEGAWRAALDAIADADAAPGGVAGPVLVLNVANPTMQKLADSDDPSVQRLSVEAIYAQLLLTGRHVVRPADQVIVSRSLGVLIERVLAG